LTVKFLAKTRYYYPFSNGLIAEIDIFKGKLKGLVFVEVEFPDKKLMDSFIPPDWFGKNITQESWAANTFLAGKSFSRIKQFLKD
jgi:CYTH domain-containing protein